MFRLSRKKGNYAYAVTRVKAKRSSLMNEDDFTKMMMMSVPEISRYITESGYNKEMTELAGRMEGINLLEHATYKNMAQTFRNILGSTKGDLYDMVSAYLVKWDIWNVKMILRGRHYGLTIEEIEEDLVPAGKLNAETLRKLLEMGSGEQIVDFASKKFGIHIPQSVVDVTLNSNDMSQIEDFLDKFRYERLLATVDSSSKPVLLFLDYVRREIDTRNYETLLKLKAEDIPGEKIMEYFIPGGKEINLALATQLANMDSVDAILADVSRFEFYEDIKSALENRTSTVSDIVAGMKQYEKRRSERFSNMHPLSVIPILDFMIKKETEVNNIRIVARGIESGLDKETIKSLLVI